ncbi:hypothetical protein EYZ11_012157 [Aspergillus tanneri]|uniref:Amino acid permease/ SLC12A domain-containing protein n=1 Tax=Aspergillus tanneri TaxID=1220188 RepID=A0A4S3J330_9EURO|nr:hypothetical protein EYZ11_012157 [Aspergillus tanneri]
MTKKTLEPSTNLETDINHGAETDLHRSLSKWHITMISLASSVGIFAVGGYVSYHPAAFTLGWAYWMSYFVTVTISLECLG